MAAIAPQASNVTGVVLNFVAATVSGDYIANTGKEFLVVKNGGASPITVTIDCVRPCDHGVDHNGGGSVAAGAEKIFGPFRKDWWDDASQRVQITYSDVTSVTVACLRVNEGGI